MSEEIKIEVKNEDKIEVLQESVFYKMLDCKLDQSYIPIIYREENNITFLGLEKLHPFDPAKYMHSNILLTKFQVIEFLYQNKVVEKDKQKFIRQKKVTQEQLLTVHTKEYLNSLYWSYILAYIAEFPLFFVVPNFLLQWFFVSPMHYQVGGTILGGEVAMIYGWCISIAGGMHHASSDQGGGCVFSDIPISIKSLKSQGKIKKSMIIDLDVHQGNGHERDKLSGFMGEKEDCYIVDAYNCWAYPRDKYAKQGIDCKLEYRSGCKGDEFIDLLKGGLKISFDEFKPDIIFYNAGTDLMDGDPLGRCCIPESDVIKRDEMVFHEALSRNIPIVMVLSGGYQQSNARVIAESIENLQKKFDIFQIAKDNYSKVFTK